MAALLSKAYEQMTKKPIRVAIFVDSMSQRAWVAKILNDIKDSDVADVHLVLKNKSLPKRKGFIRRLISGRNRIVYHLFTIIERKLSRITPNAFARTDVSDLLKNAKIFDVIPRRTRYSDYLTEDAKNLLEEFEIDVGLRFGFRILRGPILEGPKYGIWSFHHGDNRVNRGGPPYLWELLTGEKTAGSILQILDNDLDGGKVLERTVTSISSYSLTKTKNEIYWKSTRFVISKLAELYHEGPEALQLYDIQPDNFIYSAPLYRAPNNFAMSKLLVKWVLRIISRRVASTIFNNQWFLLLSTNTNLGQKGISLFRLQELEPPKGHFWADPFPIFHEDKYYIFFEEFVYSENKGHISVMVLDNNGNVIETPKEALNLGTHTSYPFIFKWEEDYYLLVENQSSGHIRAYKSVVFPFRWEPDRIIMNNVVAADPTIFEHSGLWWMFLTLSQDIKLNNWDDLHLYFSESPLGPWKPHPKNPIKSDARSARPAGKLFRYGGTVYRPSQDCSGTYGRAIVINRVNVMTPYDYNEEQVDIIEPLWRQGLTGTHTLNHTHNLTILDARKRKIKLF